MLLYHSIVLHSNWVCHLAIGSIMQIIKFSNPLYYYSSIGYIVRNNNHRCGHGDKLLCHILFKKWLYFLRCTMFSKKYYKSEGNISKVQ